jgi:sugar phosphate permease
MKKSLNEWRGKTFLITFFSYACVHLTRTTWSNVKPYF